MSRFTDIFWPTLERPPPLNPQTRSLENDIRELDQSTWTAAPEQALSEAREIYQREEERRRTTDTKASGYLLVIATVFPLLTYLESTVWEQKLGAVPEWLSLLVLGIAVLHILWAGRWAFKTLTVQTFYAMDSKDLMRIWSESEPVQGLVRETLKITRNNSDAINEKISSIKMAHIFLKRGMFWFGLLLLIQVIWYLLSTLIPLIWPTIKNVVCNN